MIYGEIKDNYVQLEPTFKPDTNAHAFEIKELLKSAGWIVKSSSDGTTVDSSGDSLTSSDAVAGGLGNALSWFRIQIPGGEFELTFQFTNTQSSNNHYRVKASETPFTTGGTATETPSSTDEQVIKGGGTDAAPIGSSWSAHAQSGNGYTCGVAETVYPFRCYFVELRDNFPYAHSGAFCVDAVESSFDDPWAHVITLPNTNFAGQLNTSSLGVSTLVSSWTIMDYDGPNKSWVDIILDSNPDVEDTPLNVDGGLDLIPAFWARRTGDGIPNGIKGWSSLFLWNHTKTSNPTVMQLTVDGNTRELIRLYDAVLPWPSGSTVTIGTAWPENTARMFSPSSFSPAVEPEAPQPIPSIGDGITAFGFREETGRGVL